MKASEQKTLLLDKSKVIAVMHMLCALLSPQGEFGP